MHQLYKMQNIYNLAQQQHLLTESFQLLCNRVCPDIGDYKWSCRQSDYSGWMVCDGRALSADIYKELYDIIGTSFGSNVSVSEFKIPDYRGRVMGAAGQGDGLTNRAMGARVGSETHTMTADEMPVHTHSGTTNVAGAHTHGTNATGGQGNAGLVTANGAGTGITADDTTGELNVMTTPIALAINSSGEHSHSFVTGVAGAGLPYSIMQPTVFGGSVFIYVGHM
jgi:microcystin-dependent protein